MLEKWGIIICRDTVRNFLKANGFRWKRKRTWPGGKRDESLIAFFKEEIKALKQAEDEGEIDLFFFDEAGFSLRSYVPYSWQKVGETEKIPSQQGGHITAMGLINRTLKGKFRLLEKAPKAEDIIAFFDEVADSTQRKTIVVLDQASTHTAAIVKDRFSHWKTKNLYFQYLPSSAPELNIIEILWRMIKYKWLTPDTYLSKNDLRLNLETVLAAIGEKYVVNFS